MSYVEKAKKHDIQDFSLIVVGLFQKKVDFRILTNDVIVLRLVTLTFVESGLNSIQDKAGSMIYILVLHVLP